MALIDQYILVIFIFSPLAASLFITLIPTQDTASKITVSKFFAIVSFLAVARIFFLWLNHKIPLQNLISFTVINFNIGLTFVLNLYNVFIYVAGAASLVVNIWFYDIKDTKTNIHQVAPFLLIFFLYIGIAQEDLRVALPLLSIANFFVYFLVSYTTKIRRGSTIFHMGIFLFACDALALVLLQTPYQEQLSPNIIILAMILPGMARLGLPLLAPFIKKFLLNIDDDEGPFLIVFLQLTGLFILIKAKMYLSESVAPIALIAGSISVVNSLYIAFIANNEHKLKSLPYYFLLFYSSLSAILIFFSSDQSSWYFCAALFLSNIVCFFNASFVAKMIRQEILESRRITLTSVWFISLVLCMGLPGLGVGTALWALIYHVMSKHLASAQPTLSMFWLIFIIGQIIAFLILSFAAILSIRELFASQETTSQKRHASSMHLAAPTLAVVMSLIIPLIVLYAQTLKA